MPDDFVGAACVDRGCGGLFGTVVSGYDSSFDDGGFDFAWFVFGFWVAVWAVYFVELPVYVEIEPCDYVGSLAETDVTPGATRVFGGFGYGLSVEGLEEDLVHS